MTVVTASVVLLIIGAAKQEVFFLARVRRDNLCFIPVVSQCVDSWTNHMARFGSRG